MNTYDELIDAGEHKRDELINELESLPDADLISIYNLIVEMLKRRKILAV